jgi:hypothetical protein
VGVEDRKKIRNFSLLVLFSSSCPIFFFLFTKNSAASRYPCYIYHLSILLFQFILFSTYRLFKGNDFIRSSFFHACCAFVAVSTYLLASQSIRCLLMLVYIYNLAFSPHVAVKELIPTVSSIYKKVKNRKGENYDCQERWLIR